MRRAPILLIAPLLALGTTWTAHAAAPSCSSVAYTTSAGDTGFKATPSGDVLALVVFFHGYGHTAKDWSDHHLCEVALRDHVQTVAMDYGPSDIGGWHVQAGADASVRAASELHVDGVPTIAYGVSMGGNASGLAVADSDVFDWWIDVEGATNVIETYAEARALAKASGDKTATTAQADIEAEMGGPLEAQPQQFAHEDVLARVANIGVKGVVMCHGAGDGLVPYDQSREMSTALRAKGIPVDFTTWGTNTHDEPGTTLDGYAPSPPLPAHTSPFAGHANEDSSTADVGVCGFDALDRLVSTPSIANAEHVRDGHTGVSA